MVGYFGAIKSQSGCIESHISMNDIESWQRHSYVKLERWEREIIFLMDRAARSAYVDVLKYHASRDEAVSAHKSKVKGNG